MLLDLNRGLRIAVLPEQARQLAVNADAAPEWPDAVEDDAQRRAEAGPLRDAVQHELSDQRAGVHHLELSGADQGLGMELALSQPIENELGALSGGDGDDAIAAAQATFEEELDRVRQAVPIAMELRKVASDRRLGQQRTAHWNCHVLLQRIFGVATCPLQIFDTVDDVGVSSADRLETVV